jgi:UDP-glucose 4-epimerase
MGRSPDQHREHDRCLRRGGRDPVSRGRSPPHGRRAPDPGGQEDVRAAVDAGRRALLQTAETLSHSTHNVGAGHVTTNGEIAAAIEEVVPGARLELRDGRDPNGPEPDAFLDISRLREDTGYEPAYDVKRGVAEYVSWLRAGNER